MMTKIDLLNIPNQSLLVTIERVTYKFNFKTVDGFMIYDVYSNNEPTVLGFRLNTAQLLLPYRYLHQQGYNFFISTANNEYYDYKKFNYTQNLFVLSKKELKEVEKIVRPS